MNNKDTNPSTSNSKDLYDIFLNYVTPQKNILIIGAFPDSIFTLSNENHCNLTSVEIDALQSETIMSHDDKIVVNDIEKINLSQHLKYKKYDLIFLNNVFERLINPTLFLNKLSNILSDDGRIIISIFNIAHGNIRLSLIDGDFNYISNSALDPNHKIFFTLNSILLFFAKCNFSIDKVDRINENLFEGVYGKTLKPYLIPKTLIDSILRDPESLVSQYVFSIVKSNISNYSTEKWVSEFSRNFVTNDLQNRINYLSSKD